MAPLCFATSAPQNCPRLPCPAARALKAEALPGLVLGELPHGEFSLLQANFALIPCSIFPLFQAIGHLHVGCSLRWHVAAILLLLGSDLWQPRGQISGLQVPLVAPRSHTPLKHLFPELKPGWNRSLSCVRVGLQEAAWHAWALQTDLKK